MHLLVNLRYLGLDIRSPVFYFPDVTPMTILQTLSAFYLGLREENMIGQLGQMRGLKGTLGISNLQYVRDSDDTKLARLFGREGIKRLYLRWTGTVATRMAEEVLGGLQPHKNLVELRIYGYGGLGYPGWIEDPSYSKLEKIVLSECHEFISLPRFGELPSLKILLIQNLQGLTQFNGDITAGFQSLETLNVENVPNLRRWDGLQAFDCHSLRLLSISSCPQFEALPQLQLLRNLKYLQIENCPLLRNLPVDGLPMVSSLLIQNCAELQQSCLTGADRVKILHISNVKHNWLGHP